jgi:hypothetical protein
MRMAAPLLSLFLVPALFLAGCVQNQPQDDSVVSAESSNEAPGTGSSESDQEKLVSVRVTGMMCPHSCLKDVKSLIEKQNDVVSIELTPQKEADVIDNPVVLVRYTGQLNKEATTKAILAAGFEKVEFTEGL